MVSTRGVKVKFYEGEKVLCYEPDLTKAKVLYESKVKDVIINKDEKGRKSVEYLIHFRGWNPSWDRCVSEEFILKDTVENRQLQRDLAQKSKLQFGSYLYRKEQKKKTSVSLEDGSCEETIMEEDEENNADPLTSSDEDSIVEDEVVPLEITKELKNLLEIDYSLINEQNKLHRLPAEPTVITILESYFKYFVNNQKCGVHDKSNSRFRSNGSNGSRQEKLKPEVLQRNINICQEVLDGLRIYFDFCLPTLLLYAAEQNQTEFMQANMLPFNQIAVNNLKGEEEEPEYTQLPYLDEEDNYAPSEQEKTGRPAAIRRRSLRSYRSSDTNSNGSVKSDQSTGKSTRSSNPNYVDNINPLLRVPTWKALPDYVYSQQPLPPCLQYGAPHLARLFVKLPELLAASNVPESKLKVLISHLEGVMEFMGQRKEWFSKDNYRDQT